jgi:putative thiamine transport system permease protein
VKARPATDTLWWGSLPLLVLFLLPLLVAVFFAVQSAADESAWMALLQHPQFGVALELSLVTGVVATLAALLLSLFLAAGIFEAESTAKNLPIIGAILAVPHLAVAIALGLLVMPTGVVARLLAIPLGWQMPPSWITTHDPYAILLVAALILKETPFLVYVLLAHLRRDDVALKFASQAQASRSLGHGSGSTWLRVFLPQLLPVLAWPLLVVFSYAATVVDLSIAIGPTQPPTLSAIIWADLNSSDPVENARGAAGAFALTGLIAIIGFAAAAAFNFVKPTMQRFYAAGPSLTEFPTLTGTRLWHAVQIIFAVLLVILLSLSFTRQWPFPDLWPTHFDIASWQAVASQPIALLTSIALGVATASGGMVILLCWFETQGRRHDPVVLAFSLLALALPSLVTGLGQYQMLLHLGLSGTSLGLYLVHLMPVVAYMFLILREPYRSFDERWIATSNALQAKPMRFLLKVKWPLLKPQLLASLAVGFAVSFGQYVPAQLAAAGRFSTLPMEAVALTSGANQPLTAAFSVMLALVPIVVFAASSIVGRPRWSRA